MRAIFKVLSVFVLIATVAGCGGGGGGSSSSGAGGGIPASFGTAEAFQISQTFSAAGNTIAIGPNGNIYVMDDSTAGHVQEFTPAGTLVRTFGTSSGAGQLFFANELAVAKNGDVLVPNTNSESTSNPQPFVAFDPNGNVINFPNLAAANLTNPGSTCVGPDGVIYIADTNGQKIAKFDGNGNYLGAISGGAYGILGIGPSGILYSVVSTSAFAPSTLGRVEPSGSVTSLATLPEVNEIGVDNHGDIYTGSTAGTLNGINAPFLQKLSPTGLELSYANNVGSIAGLAVSPTGTVYLSADQPDAGSVIAGSLP